MTGFVILHRFDRSTANPKRPIFINPELIASLEREDFTEHYTRIELASGSVVRVTEDPDDILVDIRYGKLSEA